jgi:hypothetical protein
MPPCCKDPDSPGTPLKRESFATTHWSVVLATRNVEPDRARQALERLCTTYWYPIYACVRRFGKDHAEAEDITQGFFDRLLSHQTFQHLEPVNFVARRWRTRSTIRKLWTKSCIT